MNGLQIIKEKFNFNASTQTVVICNQVTIMTQPEEQWDIKGHLWTDTVYQISDIADINLNQIYCRLIIENYITYNIIIVAVTQG